MPKRVLNKIVVALRFSYNWLKKKPSRWLVNLCTAIGKIIFQILGAAGKSYIKQIEDKIIAMSERTNLTNEEKFNAVWDFSYTLLPAWRECDLDNIIQNLFNLLKEQGRV